MSTPRKKPDINEPIPLPKVYNPMVPLDEEKFDELKPLQQVPYGLKRRHKVRYPMPDRPNFNKGTL